MPDRHLIARLPQIELTQLPGSIDRALKRPRRRREQRPHFAQIVIDHRLARLAAQRLEQLPNPNARQLRIGAQQPVNLVLERVELRLAQAAAIRRRRLASQRPPDRVARHARPARQLLDRHAEHEVLTTKLSPPLHTNHPFAASPRP